MVDRVSAETRSRMMSRIRSKDTKPEIAVRRILWGAGLRYRLHDRTLPGTPDMSNKGRRLAVFVDGCFWHGCPACYTEPKTNTAFWRGKMSRNRKRREDVRKRLKGMGFHVVEIWEHEVSDNPEAVPAKINSAVGCIAV